MKKQPKRTSPSQKKSPPKKATKPKTKAVRGKAPAAKRQTGVKPTASRHALPLLRRRIAEIVRTGLEKLAGSTVALPVLLEYARDDRFGDYACTSAMDKRWREALAAARPEYRNPQKAAQDLKASLPVKLFQSEVAGPGFLNLTLAPAVFFDYVQDACARRGEYGTSVPDKAQNIIFEFVSANPTGPLNVVSARAAALGDSCCNLLEAAGHNVHREYYVNDFGNQVNLLGQSCLLRALEERGATLKFSSRNDKGQPVYADGPGLAFPPEGYHGEYLKDVVAGILTRHAELKPSESQINAAAQFASSPNSELEPVKNLGLLTLADALGEAATDYFLETHKRDLERFRVSFSSFFRERSLHRDGSVLAVRKFLGDRVFKEEGKEVFRSTEFGDDKDRVIVREDGRPTYLLADIAYHKTKMDRGFDKLYNIWGPDHHGYIKRLSGALQAMGLPPDRFRVLIAQQVNLLDAGTPIVMSKRTGKFITMDTLLEEIPIDVTRYFFVMRSFEAHLDFDFTEAKDTSDKNPYFYVAYAHARIRSIFAKAAERGLAPLSGDALSKAAKSFQMTPERRKLLWFVARFPEELADAAESLEPHRLVTYLYQMASALQRFYAPKENKVIDQNKETAGVLLAILDAVSVCLKNGLARLGMNAPDRMDRADTPPEG